MKAGIYFTITVAAVMSLAACSEQKEQFKQKFDSTFRQEFITQCVAGIPKEAGLSAEKVQQYCTCSADKVLENLSATDLAKLMGGQEDGELNQKIVNAAAACMETLK